MLFFFLNNNDLVRHYYIESLEYLILPLLPFGPSPHSKSTSPNSVVLLSALQIIFHKHLSNFFLNVLLDSHPYKLQIRDCTSLFVCNHSAFCTPYLHRHILSIICENVGKQSSQSWLVSNKTMQPPFCQ